MTVTTDDQVTVTTISDAGDIYVITITSDTYAVSIADGLPATGGGGDTVISLDFSSADNSMYLGVI